MTHSNNSRRGTQYDPGSERRDWVREKVVKREKSAAKASRPMPPSPIRAHG